MPRPPDRQGGPDAYGLHRHLGQNCLPPCGEVRYSDLMTAIRAPDEIASPSLIASFSMTPDLWAVISFSIFIASMMVMIWPSSTVSPSLAGTFHTLPCSGETSSSPPPPPPLLRSPRLGAARPAGAAPLEAGAAPPTGGGPMTLTSKRLPLTS